MALVSRVIPVLLLHNGALYKTRKFSKPVYIGDPINAVRIFNEKEVDELVILDIDCSRNNTLPNYQLLEDIVSEAFMPIGYGGGITNFKIAKQIFELGIEKVIINSALSKNIELLHEIGSVYGVQSVVASIDVRKNLFRKYTIFHYGGSKKNNRSLIDWAIYCEESGAGELLITSIDNEGTYKGFDLEILKMLCSDIKIPIVISGGASNFSDFVHAKNFGASGMAVGSMFVFQRPHNAVLISYPKRSDLDKLI